MLFNLKLFEGTDSIKFGMRSSEIKKIFGVEPSLFKKSGDDLYPCEAYEGIVHIYYEQVNDELVSTSFEFLPTVKVFYDGEQLMGRSYDSMTEFFKSKFKDCRIDYYGCYSTEFDISFYFNETRNLESVCIARKGYFKSEEDRLEIKCD